MLFELPQKRKNFPIDHDFPRVCRLFFLAQKVLRKSDTELKEQFYRKKNDIHNLQEK